MYYARLSYVFLLVYLCLSGSVVMAARGRSGTASSTPPQRKNVRRSAVGKLPSVTLSGIPHIRQRPDFCGEACVEMVLRSKGHAVDQNQVFAATGVDPLQGRGAYANDLKRALTRLGFHVGVGWYYISAARAEKELEAQFLALVSDLHAGFPSIVCTHYDQSPHTTEHFRLVVGYDAYRDEVIYHEPALTNGAFRRMPKKTFLALWPLKYAKEKWTVIRFRMQLPGPPTLVPQSGFGAAAYAQHIMQLKKKVGRRPFTMVISEPFVVVGDESPAVVKKRARSTVRWAVQLLKKAYFKKDPQRLLTIWLFKDNTSYRTHAQLFFGDKPGTPFGYYDDDENALVMNIATGGGTLVHEIVHPFVEANFPGCPAWFNEGLGSLYEQSGQHQGHIVGYTNWRLAGLQQAITHKRVPSFHTLLRTSNAQFYNEDPGTNYAQARYLLYYLQQQGKLHEYYRRFYRNRAKDPTGLATLKSVLGIRDLQKFQTRWEKYVMALRFP